MQSLGSEGCVLVFFCLFVYFFCKVFERERGALIGRILKVILGYVMERSADSTKTSSEEAFLEILPL